jgi:hypothetical protein
LPVALDFEDFGFGAGLGLLLGGLFRHVAILAHPT